MAFIFRVAETHHSALYLLSADYLRGLIFYPEMESVPSSETSVNCLTTRRLKPEDNTLETLFKFPYDVL
jgi:hypothetical protein